MQVLAGLGIEADAFKSAQPSIGRWHQRSSSTCRGHCASAYSRSGHFVGRLLVSLGRLLTKRQASAASEMLESVTEDLTGAGGCDRSIDGGVVVRGGPTSAGSKWPAVPFREALEACLLRTRWCDGFKVCELRSKED
ncbi:hypothetical protein O1611_g4041 [Lasiodiplodia mahajangana]|uniref:Uncharacterized protein n=1 Tax=Lasiodiplodia mahajangana TaxID=1108764 RepID=A0ACC2JQ06_9PEZI|nr:hypothetical protein O1611_g4041 [Lasiodiplodia mahajangana]